MLEALPEFTSKLEVLLAAGFFGYLAGSIPFGILISKFLGLGELNTRLPIFATPTNKTYY